MIVTELMDRLEIGDWVAAEKLRQNRYVVTVAIDSPVVGHSHFKLVDGPGNNQIDFKNAVDCVVAAHRNGRNVLVHCVGGRSRSAAVCVAAMAQLKNTTLHDAYEMVIAKHAPARIHPYLSKMLLA